MTRKEYLKEVKGFLDTVYKTVEQKSADYGNVDNPFGGFASAQIIGIPIEKSLLTRTVEKIVRVDNLLTKPNSVKGETILDSIQDIVGYMAILNAYVKMQNMSRGK